MRTYPSRISSGGNLKGSYKMTDMEKAASNLLKIMDAPLGAQWRNVGASLMLDTEHDSGAESWEIEERAAGLHLSLERGGTMICTWVEPADAVRIGQRLRMALQCLGEP
jgi:hypothetical protein